MNTQICKMLLSWPVPATNMHQLLTETLRKCSYTFAILLEGVAEPFAFCEMPIACHLKNFGTIIRQLSNFSGEVR